MKHLWPAQTDQSFNTSTFKDAARTIDIISFDELRKLHTVAATKFEGQIGKPKAEFAAIQWTRYAHGITAKMKIKPN